MSKMMKRKIKPIITIMKIIVKIWKNDRHYEDKDDSSDNVD